MKFSLFGRRSGLRVSEYALGTGNFGTGWGFGADREESRRIFHRFADAGGTFLDTAGLYQGGESEQITGELIAGDRDRFVVASKYSYRDRHRRGNSLVGNGRKNMVVSVEESLRRLGTDHLDMLWVHIPDGLTPMEEIAKAFDDLISAGKLHHGGLSNFPAWRTAHAVDIADSHGWSPISAIQVEYSLVERTADRELLPMAEAFGLGVALWSPLGGGLLSGKYRAGESGRLTGWQRSIQLEDSSQKTRVLDTVLEIAAELGHTAVEVSLSWLLDRSRSLATTTVPIIGPRTVAHLDTYLKVLELHLPLEALERLDQVSAVQLGAPHDDNDRNLASLNGQGEMMPRASPVA